MLPVEQPFKTYTGLDGKPLENGYVYIGKPNQNPANESQRVTIYWDAAGTIPAEQPLRTVGGYIMRGGTPANVFFDGEYSELVRDSKMRQVAYAQSSENFSLAAVVRGYVTKFASIVGAALIGFSQGAAGAVPLTLEDVLRENVSVARFGAIGDSVHDDTAAIQAAIDSFPNASSCAVRFLPGRTYNIKGTIYTRNRSVLLDGQNAILVISGNVEYGIKITGTNCEVRNLQINRASGAQVTAAVYLTGLQHVIQNVTSRAQTWPTFILSQDLKESHFTQIRVDNDVTGLTGKIFQFDYCVNNTVSNSMVGFCAQAFYGSGLGQPTSNYHNEGILISNVITVYAGKAVNFDNGTFIAITNCCFDFCETIGVFVSNGTDLMVSNTWIASNLTDDFLGIGTLSGVDGVSIQNCTFVRGAKAIAGARGVSLPGPSALVLCNRFRLGMSGGVVTQSTSQVGFNSVTGGGTNIIANNSVSTVVGSMSIEKFLTIPTGGALRVGGNEGIYPIALSGSASAGNNGALPAQTAGYYGVIVEGEMGMIPFFKP